MHGTRTPQIAGIFSGIFLLTLAGTADQPTNEVCGDALPISFGTVSGDLKTAIDEGVANCLAAGTSADLWYRSTASDDTTLFLSTDRDSEARTVISVYDRCPDRGGASLRCAGGTFSYPLELEVSAGETRWIRVAGEGAYDLTVEATGRISGRVVDDLGQPVADADLEINSLTYNFARTNADGRYSLEVRAGSYDVFVVPPAARGVVGARLGGAFCMGNPLGGGHCEAADVDFVKVDPGKELIIDWELPRFALLRGRVTRKSDGAPLEGVEIVAASIETAADFSTETAADGSYEVRVFPRRPLAVTARHRSARMMIFGGIPCRFGCNPADGKPVEIAPGETKEKIDFGFHPIERIAW